MNTRYQPQTPMEVTLYQLCGGLERAHDLTGLRRLWTAIVPEFKALNPNGSPQVAVEYRDSPGEKVFALGWRVYEKLTKRHSHKTGRKVLDAVYHSGFATEYRKVSEWETDPTEIHAAFMRILARYGR